MVNVAENVKEGRLLALYFSSCDLLWQDFVRITIKKVCSIEEANQTTLER
jgi:hypothetical protein